jgi:nucleoside-diphosphate kinase
MIEQTLILLKPDALQRGLVGEIISRFERTGLKLVAMKMVTSTYNQAKKHYEFDNDWFMMVGKRQKKDFEEKGIVVTKSELELGQDVQEQLLTYLTMSPIMALVIEGHNAVAQIRKIVGKTSPYDAVPGTIRGDYCLDTYALADNSNRSVQNLIHASGNIEEAKKEIYVWFNKDEIHSWKKLDEVLLYRGIENIKK